MNGTNNKAISSLPILVTQFFGVFNDNAFKWSILLAVTVSDASMTGDSTLMAMLTVAYVLPFIVFPDITGYFSDKFSKRYVMIFGRFAELIIMLLGALCFYYVGKWGVYPLVGVMFLMAAQSAFVSPALNGVIPEIYHEKDISSVNGKLNMSTNIAIILGVAAAYFLKEIFHEKIFLSGICFSFCSFLGILSALSLVPVPSANKMRKLTFNFFRERVATFKRIFLVRGLASAIFGDAFFLAVGTAFQLVSVLYARYNLEIKIDDFIGQGLIMVAPAVGLGLGSLVAGKSSDKKIELGLVPPGAFGLAASFITAAVFPGPYWIIGNTTVYPFLMLSIVLVGFFGGIYLVPLRAFMQYKPPKKDRGTILANANVISFLAILLGNISQAFLVAGNQSDASQSGLNKLADSLGMGFSPPEVLIILGISVIVFNLVLFIFLPDFIFRFFILCFSDIFFKIRKSGVDNIPEKGSGVIVANHVSYIDPLLITLCTSRKIYFIMHRDYYRFKFFNLFFKWAGFIKEPDGSDADKNTEFFRKVRRILQKGGLVCIFPEGKISRNGIMDVFRKGIKPILPDDINVPVIPLRLGMLWGSFFSYYRGRVKFKLPLKIPDSVSISFGNPVSADTSPFQLRQILSELASEAEKNPRKDERPIHYQFVKNTKKHPFRKNIIDESGKSHTNFELLIKSLLLSRLIRKKTQNEEYIGILLPNSSHAFIAILAVLYADKVPAVLNFTSVDTLNASKKKAELKTILTSKKFIDKIKLPQSPEMLFLEDLAREISSKDKKRWVFLSLLLPRQEIMKIVAPESHRDVFKTAVVLFSSGSTGQPKGVMLSHHNINSNVYSFSKILGWTKSDSIAGSLPLFHSFGFETAFWVPIMLDSSVVYIMNPLDSHSVSETIEKYQLSILLATPTFLKLYLRKADPSKFACLRLLVTGAEKLPQKLADDFQRATGIIPMEGYGCTELSPVVSVNISNSILDLGKRVGPRGSVGVAMPGICAKILSVDNFKELPPGKEGLLFVKGPNLMKGYLNDPEETEKVIINEFYNTGDMAQMSENAYITITGRISRFSKIGGEMVPHERIEESISNLTNVSEKKTLAVMSASDEKKGEKIIVFYTPESGIENPQSIIRRLRRTDLPNLWIPKKENFHQIDEIPILGSGKLNLRKLREKTAELYY